jgi:hypothetical protein
MKNFLLISNYDVFYCPTLLIGAYIKIYTRNLFEGTIFILAWREWKKQEYSYCSSLLLLQYAFSPPILSAFFSYFAPSPPPSKIVSRASS